MVHGCTLVIDTTCFEKWLYICVFLQLSFLCIFILILWAGAAVRNKGVAVCGGRAGNELVREDFAVPEEGSF